MKTDDIIARYKKHRLAIRAPALKEIEELNELVRANTKAGRNVANYDVVSRRNAIQRKLPEPTIEYEVMTFTALLLAEDFHHIAAGSNNAGEWLHVYKNFPLSPSGCIHAISFPKIKEFTDAARGCAEPAMAYAA